MTQREALTKILTENQSDDTFRASENAVAAAVDVLLAHGVTVPMNSEKLN